MQGAMCGLGPGDLDDIEHNSDDEADDSSTESILTFSNMKRGQLNVLPQHKHEVDDDSTTPISSEEQDLLLLVPSPVSVHLAWSQP